MNSLKDKSVVVIGGSSGLGLAVAAMAAESGAKVTVAARSIERLRQAEALIGRSVTTRVVDGAEEEQVAQLFNSIDEVDHIFVSVGVVGGGTLLETATSEHRSRLDARVWAAAYAAKYGAPKMHEGGSITFCSGTAGVRPRSTGNPLAAASAGAVEAMTRILSLQLAPIRVNSIVPGIVDTPLWKRAVGDRRQAFLESTATSLPVGRVGQPEDIAHAVQFLMENGFVTGQSLIVDGGGVLV